MYKKTIVDLLEASEVKVKAEMASAGEGTAREVEVVA